MTHLLYRQIKAEKDPRPKTQDPRPKTQDPRPNQDRRPRQKTKPRDQHTRARQKSKTKDPRQKTQDARPKAQEDNDKRPRQKIRHKIKIKTNQDTRLRDPSPSYSLPTFLFVARGLSYDQTSGNKQESGQRG